MHACFLQCADSRFPGARLIYLRMVARPEGHQEDGDHAEGVRHSL